MVKNGKIYNTIVRNGVTYNKIVRNGVVLFSTTPTPPTPVGGDTELEYIIIPNNNCQFALLTTPNKSNYYIEFKVMPDGGVGASGFIGNDGCAFGVGKHYMDEPRWMQWTDGWQLAETGVPYNSVETIITLTHNNTSGSVTINDITTSFPSTNISGTFHLDGGAEEEDEGALTGRWYYAKEYLNGSLVHNYIPVIRESDDKVCFKDTITNTYIEDTHSETWTAGPTK